MSNWPAYQKGSPAAMAWKQKMDAAKREARARAEEQARAVLGPTAPAEQIEAFIKEAQRAQRQANAASREMKRQNKIAAENMRAAANATINSIGAATLPPPQPAPTPSAPPPVPPPPPPPPPPAAPPPIPPIQPPPQPTFSHPSGFYDQQTTQHDELYNHPIFGSLSQPQGVASVSIYRLPSDLPEHRGVTPGYLQSMSYEDFSEDAVRINHGGGRYRAVAKDSLGRVIRSGDFTISGRAKAYAPPEDENLRNSRITTVFRADGEDIPTPFKLYMEQQDKRMERLEALLEAQLSSHQSTDEDKLERWKRELEAKEEQEQRRHERRLAEIKAEVEANNAREQARLNAQMEFMKTIVQSQSGVNNMLMTALVENKNNGGTEKFIVPMIEATNAMMKGQSAIFGQMMSIMRDSMGGEDNRTTGQRILDMVERGVSGLWDKAGDQMLMQIVSQLGKPKENAIPQSIPSGSAFQLPDGRIVPPEICAQFVNRYRQLHGVNPSMEVCVAAFTNILNSQNTQPNLVAPVSRPAQQAPFTQEQAEEFVRQAQQRTAEEATRAGKTPEEVRAAAQTAAQQALAQLRSIVAGQADQAAPANVTPPPAPAAVAAATGSQSAAAAPPPPAQAALEAQKTATMTVQPGPVPPPGDVQISWMHRGFLQFVIDSFQARQNPVDFLFLALQQGKISPDAKLMIGRIYEESGEDEELKSILTKVAGLLVERGVNLPSEFLTVFGNAPEGESWLETFLFACTCSTKEEAIARLQEED
jgi:hypothetical protein